MDITIRRASAADAEHIAAIYNQGIDDRSATFESTHRTAAELVGRIADADRWALLVADDGRAVVGWAGLSTHWCPVIARLDPRN